MRSSKWLWIIIHHQYNFNCNILNWQMNFLIQKTTNSDYVTFELLLKFLNQWDDGFSQILFYKLLKEIAFELNLDWRNRILSCLVFNYLDKIMFFAKCSSKYLFFENYETIVIRSIKLWIITISCSFSLKVMRPVFANFKTVTKPAAIRSCCFLLKTFSIKLVRKVTFRKKVVIFLTLKENSIFFYEIKQWENLSLELETKAIDSVLATFKFVQNF